MDPGTSQRIAAAAKVVRMSFGGAEPIRDRFRSAARAALSVQKTVRLNLQEAFTVAIEAVYLSANPYDRALIMAEVKLLEALNKQRTGEAVDHRELEMAATQELRENLLGLSVIWEEEKESHFLAAAPE